MTRKAALANTQREEEYTRREEDYTRREVDHTIPLHKAPFPEQKPSAKASAAKPGCRQHTPHTFAANKYALLSPTTTHTAHRVSV
eukprot:scaffold301_cov243-Pinguiococcus_pyrenoidosus.AAC.53